MRGLNRYRLQKKLPLFLTGLFALFLTLLPIPLAWQVYRPDWVLLWLLYWSLQYKFSYPVLTAWCMGLLKDALVQTLLGQYALSLSMVAYVMGYLARQVQHFSLLQQAIGVMLMSSVTQVINYGIQNGLLHAPPNALGFFMVPCITGLLWPWWASFLDQFCLSPEL